MRARGRGMTWWARTAQKSGSRLLPNAAVPVWLSSALRTSAMAPEKKLETGAPCPATGRAIKGGWISMGVLHDVARRCSRHLPF